MAFSSFAGRLGATHQRDDGPGRLTMIGLNEIWSRLAPAMQARFATAIVGSAVVGLGVLLVIAPPVSHAAAGQLDPLQAALFAGATRGL